MTEEAFEKFKKEFKELASKHLKDPDDTVSMFVRGMAGSLSYTGTDCIVCLSDIIQQGFKDGDIKHNGEEIEYDENDDEIIKH